MARAMASPTLSHAKDWPLDRQKRLKELICKINLGSYGSRNAWGPVLECLRRAQAELCMYAGEDDAPDYMELVARVCDSCGLLDRHGEEGVGWPRLTNEGILLLAFLETFGTKDTNGWPKWAVSEQVIP
jgi:hypothetical protein